MSAPPKLVEKHELVFFFQTNEPIPARPLLNFLFEVDRIAHTRRHLGPSAVVEILEVRTGTKLIRLSFDRKVALGSLAVAVVALGNDLASRIAQPEGRLAQSVAEMCLDHGVAECVITTPEGQIRINRDEMPAIETVEANRNRTSLRYAEKAASFPIQVDEAVSASELEAVPAADFVRQRGEILADFSRPRDGRVYTVVGTLRAPGSPGNTVPRSRGQFRAQSGKAYIARGVDWSRWGAHEDLVVIRAAIADRDGEFTVLDVKDVFEPEEP